MRYTVYGPQPKQHRPISIFYANHGRLLHTVVFVRALRAEDHREDYHRRFLNHTMNCEPYAPMPMTPENLFVVVRNQTFINSTKKETKIILGKSEIPLQPLPTPCTIKAPPVCILIACV